MPSIQKILLNSFRKTQITGWSGLVLGPIVLAVFLLFIIWSSTFARIHQEETIELEGIQTSDGNITQIIATNLDEVLSRANIYADMATAIAKGKGKQVAGLNPATFGDHAFLRLAIFDTQQHLIFSSAHRTIEPLLTSLLNETIKEHHSNSMVVGHPSSDNIQEIWRVPVLLPLGENAEFGYLGGHLDLGYFLKLYRDVNIGQRGKIELIGDNGYQLIESSGMTISPGHNIATSNYFSFVKQQEKGSGIVRRPGENFDSLTTFHHLDNFPFVVAVSRRYDEAMSEHVTRYKLYIRDAILQTLTLLIAAISLAFLAQRQRLSFNESRHSEQKKQQLIEKLEEQKKLAFQQATHDHLTGLPNRLQFSEVAQSRLLAARRSRYFNAVFFIDLDHFKQINDTFGHRVGDLLLCEVSRRLQSCVRESDIAARFGGDEFVMLISEVNSIDDIGVLANKIIATVGGICKNLGGHDIEVRPSLGISIYGRDGQDIESLLKHADTALYEAKAAGRGTFRFFDMILNRTTELHAALLQRAGTAVANSEFNLHFQAKVALENAHITGLEALIRWQHPEFGMIYPADFIPLAEENGLIIPLGDWVIDTAFQQLAMWRKSGVPLVPVAINVSHKQLQDDEFVGRILHALEKYSLPGELLEIEITECCVVNDSGNIIARLTALREKGVRISMDDYGVGFSNLSMLKSLPIHSIKIDRSLICEIHNQPNDSATVDSTITLAHKLGFIVVAEGVETREQLLKLKVAGCDEIQGYLLHRPVTASEIEPILRQGKIAL